LISTYTTEMARRISRQATRTFCTSAATSSRAIRPLPPGTDGPQFRAAWLRTGLPHLAAWAPELIVISAGFDAHRADPLADLRLDTADFGWITDQILAIADRVCGGRVVSIMEGGYDPDALAASAALHVRRLMRQ